MKSNYRKLGDFIEQTEERNKDLAISLSQGICNLKYFQNPRQVAENSAADKIVRSGWFAYNRATTRNGDKISIAFRDKEDCTVSASYLTFKIKDENLLNPYYLMLWFKRPEFDRYARFKSHGSAHEYFEWEEMCDIMLPVPSIEEQRKIVAEYQAVERRIENNRRLIANLEETAQTIYRHMFVDHIDPENLPQGWRFGNLGEIVDSFDNKRKPVAGYDRENAPQIYPYYGATSKMGYIDDFIFDGDYVLLGEDGSVVKENGTPYLQQIYGKTWVNNHAHVLSAKNQWNNSLLYIVLSITDVRDIITGGVQLKINQKNLMNLSILIPDNITLQKAKKLITPLDYYKRELSLESEKLSNLLSLLLSKLSKLN